MALLRNDRQYILNVAPSVVNAFHVTKGNSEDVDDNWWANVPLGWPTTTTPGAISVTKSTGGFGCMVVFFRSFTGNLLYYHFFQ